MALSRHSAMSDPSPSCAAKRTLISACQREHPEEYLAYLASECQRNGPARGRLRPFE
jgi:hypothetical protein